jgi:hypothetical protein
MLAQGAGERPGLRCIVWDVAEVGARQQRRFPADITPELLAHAKGSDQPGVR